MPPALRSSPRRSNAAKAASTPLHQTLLHNDTAPTSSSALKTTDAHMTGLNFVDGDASHQHDSQTVDGKQLEASGAASSSVKCHNPATLPVESNLPLKSPFHDPVEQSISQIRHGKGKEVTATALTQETTNTLDGPSWAFPRETQQDIFSVAADEGQPEPHDGINQPKNHSYRIIPESSKRSIYGIDVPLERLVDTSDDEVDDEDADEEALAISHKWEFRESTRASIVYFNTWIDHDTSGNYDPDLPEDAPITVGEKRKRPTTQTPNGLPGREHTHRSKKPKLTSRLYARQHGIGLDVVLKLPSKAGKELLARYQDNWPEDSWNTITGGDIAPRFANGADIPFESIASIGIPYALRRRTTNADLDDDIDITDLTGHPVARGCKACYSIGQRCSLLDPGATYPCDLCLEDDENCDCELLVAPKRKATCESCKRRRRHCSYTDADSNHALDCDQCAETGAFCIAGPGPDPLRARIAEDGTPAIPAEVVLPPIKAGRAPPKDRKLPAKRGKRIPCQPCINADTGKKCSLRRNAETWPCQGCEKQGLFCMLDINDTGAHPLPTIDYRLFALRQHGAVLRSKLLPSQPFVPAPKPAPLTTTPTLHISTLLAHPVRFNAPPHSTFKPCHWHLSPAFGLTGLGPPPSAGCGTAPVPPASVSVTQLSTRLGFRELAGGHTASGLLPCRMCEDCTMARVEICACAEHRMQPIASSTSPQLLGGNAATTDADDANNSETAHKAWHAAFQALLQTKPGTPAHRRGLSLFCTLCPQLARYACHGEEAAETTPAVPDMKQAPVMAGDSGGGVNRDRKGKERASAAPEPEQADTGCGLRLCTSCCDLLESEGVDGDLDKAISSLRQILGTRGDVAGEIEGSGSGEEDVVKAFWPLGLRADYELLAGDDGFLMKQVLGSAGD